MNQIHLEFPPASRSTDNAASHRAESEQNKSGWRLHDSKIVLLALYAHPNSTSKSLAESCGLDRYMVARRLPDLLKNGLADRVEDEHDGWRWSVTGKGLAEIATINGRNYAGRP